MPRNRKKKSSGSGINQQPISQNPASQGGPSKQRKKKKKRKSQSQGLALSSVTQSVSNFPRYQGGPDGSLRVFAVDFWPGPIQSTGPPFNGGVRPLRPSQQVTTWRQGQNFDKYQARKTVVTFTPTGGVQAAGLFFMGYAPDPGAAPPTGPDAFTRLKVSVWGPVNSTHSMSFLPADLSKMFETDGATAAASDANSWGSVMWAFLGVGTGLGGILSIDGDTIFFDPE